MKMEMSSSSLFLLETDTDTYNRAFMKIPGKLSDRVTSLSIIQEYLRI